MSQSFAQVRDAYDLAAEAYAEGFLDELNHKPRDRELLGEFATTVGAGKRVLDLGCGPGHTTAYLASLGLDPVGIDLSPKMVAKASALFPSVPFEVGDFTRISEDDESVEGILAFYCIVHLQKNQLLLAFQEMFRVLRPGGVLLIAFHVGAETITVDRFLDTDAMLEFTMFSVDEVRCEMASAGFEKIDVHERPPYETEHPTTRCYLLATKGDQNKDGAESSQ